VGAGGWHQRHRQSGGDAGGGLGGPQPVEKPVVASITPVPPPERRGQGQAVGTSATAALAVALAVDLAVRKLLENWCLRPQPPLHRQVHRQIGGGLGGPQPIGKRVLASRAPAPPPDHRGVGGGGPAAGTTATARSTTLRPARNPTAHLEIVPRLLCVFRHKLFIDTMDALISCQNPWTALGGTRPRPALGEREKAAKGLRAAIGKWPGDETEEQIRLALEELR
jgi:hypothetical protein